MPSVITDKDKFDVKKFDFKSYGVGMFNSMRSHRESGGIDERWVRDNDLYDAVFSPEERKVSQLLGVARVFIPKTYAQVQRILEDVLETFFFDFEEIASVRTRKKSGLPSQAIDAVKTLVNYRLDGNPINFYQEAYEFCLDGIKNKMGIFKVYPELKTTKVPKKDTDGNPMAELEEKISFYQPRIETLPYEDVFFHVDSTWKDYWTRTIVHRKKVSRDYCRRRAFKNLDAIQSAGSDATTDQVKMQRRRQRGSPFNDDSQSIKAAKGVYLYEFWDFFPGADGLLEGGSFIMGGDTDGPKVIFEDWKKNDLPFKFNGEDTVRPPIIVGTAFPEPHMMWGKSFPEVTEGLQKETNISRNQEREAVARWLRAPILVNRNANVDVMGLMIRRIGGVVQADEIGPNAVQELQQQTPIPVTQPSGARIDADYAEISSITPSQLGASSGGEQSATEFAGLDRNANKKIKMVVRNMAITGIIPAMKYLLRLEQQYESDEMVQLVTGERLGWRFKKDKDGNYEGMPPSLLIQGEFDVYVNLGVNKQAQLGQFRALAELGNQMNSTLVQMVQFGLVNPQEAKFFNPKWAFDKMAPLLGQRNTDEMYIQATPPPPPQPGAGNVPRGAPSAPRSRNGTETTENVITR